MRLFGFYESYDGYLNNPGTPRENGQRTESSSDIGEGDQYGVRATIAGDITDRLSTFITLRHNELDGPNNTWIRELDGDFEYGNTVDVSFNPRHLRDTQGASVQFDYDFDDVLATLITSYTQTDSERDTELDMDKEWVLDLFRPEEFEAKTVEFRLSSQNDAPLQWQAGVYALDLTRDLSSVLNVRGGYCFLDPGDCSPQPPSNDNEIQAVLPFEVSLKEREQLAAFANITYRFNDWEFSAGIRADDWESKRTNVDTGLSGTQTDTEILSRASLTWFDPDSDSIVYGTFSQGFEPGDLNLANFSGENTLFGYDAEKANQYEVGYKGRINDSKVAITAAAFYIDYQDRQFELQTTDPAGGFVEGIINLGDSTQWGLESDVIYLINDNWTATVGVGYVNAEWNDGVISPVSGVDLSGQRPPNTAEISGTFALDYETEIDSGALLSARIQTRYKGDSSTNSQFFDMPGDDFPYWENPSFVVVDIGGAIQWSSWEARLHIENIFDEEYYIDVQEFPNFAGTALSGNPGSIIVGSLEQPRRAVLSLSYDF
jgi:iron complex outermembrane receptor protein